MWSPLLPTAFHGSRRTRAPSPAPAPSPTGLSPPPELPSSQLRLGARIRVAPCREAPMAAQPRARVGCSPHAHARFGLVRVRSPLLAELFLLLGVLRCFSSPGSPPSAYRFSGGCRPMTGSGLPPFGYPRLNAHSTAPRGFSLSVASFLGLQRQGIPHVRLLAYGNRFRTSQPLRSRICYRPYRRGRTSNRGPDPCAGM